METRHEMFGNSTDIVTVNLQLTIIIHIQHDLACNNLLYERREKKDVMA